VGNPSCIGIGVLMQANTASGDGSLGHDYFPAIGETVTQSKEGESYQPFAMMDDVGWSVPGEIANCTCNYPERGDLLHPGTHTLVSTPCSTDIMSWAAGDKAAQCTAAGGKVGPLFTTNLVVLPEPPPLVTAHRLIDCDAQTEIATLSDGETFVLDPDAVGNPSCIGIGVLMQANTATGDGSLGHDYFPAIGETVTQSRWGENGQPFAMMDDVGWSVPGEIANCTCDYPERGDLLHPGTHYLVSTPCSADIMSWTAGDKAAQCTAAGGKAGPIFSTEVVVIPEPSRWLMLVAGLGSLVIMYRVRGPGPSRP
jgi:hypothetical protein